MNLNRRDLFKGIGAFAGAASAYKASEAGILLPYDKIITKLPSHWGNCNMITAFEGVAKSLTISAERDGPFDSALSVSVFGKPITTQIGIEVDMDLVGFVPGDILKKHSLFVQIFYRA